MRNFILVKDALTDRFIIIRKSMISSVDEDTKYNKSVRRIQYVDCRPPEYVSNTLLDILNDLEKE